MNENQTIEIRNYLLSKKLPLDLLLEVQDHFLSQISHLEIEENLSFDEAFEKVKLSWKHELKMKNYGNGKLFSKLNYGIINNNGIKMGIYTLLMSVIALVLLFLCVRNSSFEIFKKSYYFLIYAAIFVPTILAILNFKSFLLIKKYKGLKLNTHQNNMILIFIAYIFMFKQLNSSSQGSLMRFYNYSNGITSNGGFNQLIIVFIISLFYFAGLYSQIQFIKAVEKTKPFLKNFQNYAK